MEIGMPFGAFTLTALDALVAVGIALGALWAGQVTWRQHRKPDGLPIYVMPLLFVFCWILATGGILILLGTSVLVVAVLKAIVGTWWGLLAP
jgi:hypothetical protein